jgi:hypothetical protein
MTKRLSLSLVVFSVLGIGWYFYPLRQQAIYFNQCVEGSRNGLTVPESTWIWYGKPVSRCMGR